VDEHRNGRLDGKVVLVAGGAGNIGREIVAAMLAAGAAVAVPSRDPERLAQLESSAGGAGERERLLTIQAEVSAPDGAEHVRDQVVASLGGLDAVAAAVGGWWQGAPLWEVPVDTFDRVLASNLRSHFVIARTFMPVLLDRPGSSYTFVNGTAAENPTPNAGPASVAAAAQLMLMRTLAAETRSARVRVNLLLLGPVLTAARRGEQHPDWITGQEVGELAAFLASDRARMISGSVLHLPRRPEPAS
jgi:NAD(P)-dependent dehydrogenase (short-subunit alcohol dehydrogenase family)